MLNCVIPSCELRENPHRIVSLCFWRWAQAKMSFQCFTAAKLFNTANYFHLSPRFNIVNLTCAYASIRDRYGRNAQSFFDDELRLISPRSSLNKQTVYFELLHFVR